jgi:hypothetical protein
VTGGFTDSPDKKLRVYGRCFGALGRDYIATSTKQVRITIVANDERETTLFRKEYSVHGADVGWTATWDQSTNLTVVIYDYGDGIAFNGLIKDEPPKRVFHTLFYCFDPKTGKFAEKRVIAKGVKGKGSKASGPDLSN